MAVTLGDQLALLLGAAAGVVLIFCALLFTCGHGILLKSVFLVLTVDLRLGNIRIGRRL